MSLPSVSKLPSASELPSGLSSGLSIAASPAPAAEAAKTQPHITSTLAVNPTNGKLNSQGGATYPVRRFAKSLTTTWLQIMAVFQSVQVVDGNINVTTTSDPTSVGSEWNAWNILGMATLCAFIVGGCAILCFVPSPKLKTVDHRRLATNRARKVIEEDDQTDTNSSDRSRGPSKAKKVVISMWILTGRKCRRLYIRKIEIDTLIKNLNLL